MIVVEFEDSQYGDLMQDIECFDEMADKAKKVVKKITHLIGENSMSMRGKKYPKEDEYYSERGRMGMRGHKEYDDEDIEYRGYGKRYM